MNAMNDAVLNILERISQLDDDAAQQLSDAIESLLNARRAAKYEARHHMRLRFNEPCVRGTIPSKMDVSILERVKRWWQHYAITVERVHRRGIVIRLFNWRMRSSCEVVVSQRLAAQILKFLIEAAPGRLRITASNGTVSDFIEVPGQCRQKLLAELKSLLVRK